jgi:hypothetical protein
MCIARLEAVDSDSQQLDRSQSSAHYPSTVTSGLQDLMNLGLQRLLSKAVSDECSLRIIEAFGRNLYNFVTESPHIFEDVLFRSQCEHTDIPHLVSVPIIQSCMHLT